MIGRFRLLAFALALAACSAGPRMHVPRDFRPGANPSAVIAAELAFARAAQEKGQWTAFAEYAADDAVMFVPEPVNAKEWLRKQTNPARAVAWQPHQVWSSCDGTLAVTRGAWQRPDGTVGTFTTVWRRQKDGAYNWVLDTGAKLDRPLAEPEMISAQVADCGNPLPDIVTGDGPARFASFHWKEASDDRTLAGELFLDHDLHGDLGFSFVQEGGRGIPSVAVNGN